MPWYFHVMLYTLGGIALALGGLYVWMRRENRRPQAKGQRWLWESRQEDPSDWPEQGTGRGIR